MSLSEERLQKTYNYLKYIGLVKTQKDFAEKIGTKNVSMSHAMHGNPRYLTKSLFSKVYKTYKDIFSEKWLLTGEGEMLANTSTYVNANGTNATAINENNNNINNETEKWHDIHDARPIIPKYLASKPNTDVYEIVSMNKNLNLDTLVAIPPYKDFDFYYQVRQDAMRPIYVQGDVLALVHLSKNADVIQGAAMVLDTKDFGFLLRRVYDRGDSYECRCINEKSCFENQIINKEKVIRLYRVVYSIRLGD